MATSITDCCRPEEVKEATVAVENGEAAPAEAVPAEAPAAAEEAPAQPEEEDEVSPVGGLLLGLHNGLALGVAFIADLSLSD